MAEPGHGGDRRQTMTRDAAKRECRWHHRQSGIVSRALGEKRPGSAHLGRARRRARRPCRSLLRGFAPYIFHPLAPDSAFDAQIPKKGDQRQMEPWQRIGVYAAGLALDSAGVKGNADILGHMDMIVAAGGGERDTAVDGAIIIAGLRQKAPSMPAVSSTNGWMSDHLRPTLFLAQLSNLLAGNISPSSTASPAPRARSWARNPAGSRRRAHRACPHSSRTERHCAGRRLGERRAQGSGDALRVRRLLSPKGAFAPVWQRADRPGFA